MNLQTEIPALPVLVPLALILIAVGVLRLRRTGQLTAMRTVTVVAATIYLAAVLRLTTLPLQIALGKYANTVVWYEKINWIPLFIDPRTFVLNIIMTVPLGVLLPLLTPICGVRQIAIIGLAFSAVIEVVQLCTNLFLSSGDMADVNDLLANTLGAVVGFLLFRRLTRIGVMADLAARFRTFDEPSVSVVER